MWRSELSSRCSPRPYSLLVLPGSSNHDQDAPNRSSRHRLSTSDRQSQARHSTPPSKQRIRSGSAKDEGILRLGSSSHQRFPTRLCPSSTSRRMQGRSRRFLESLRGGSTSYSQAVGFSLRTISRVKWNRDDWSEEGVTGEGRSV